MKEVMKKVLLWLIKFYQRRISPYLPPTCRFHPTCSEYARQAIELHGPLMGTLLAIRRIVRCNPFVQGGFDPVPMPQGVKDKMVQGISECRPTYVEAQPESQSTSTSEGALKEAQR